MELIRHFSNEQYAAALEAWSFLDLAGKTPLFTSPFGDVFLRDGAGVWFLDTLDGTLACNWDTIAQLQAELNTLAGRDAWLGAGLAGAAAAAGVLAEGDDVLDFRIAPCLGGPMDVGNVVVTDFVVSLSVAGQIRDQIRGLPVGTSISGITIDGGAAG